MNTFEDLKVLETEGISGGGLASLAAGTLAGGLIGTFVSLPYAAYRGDVRIVGKAAIIGGSAGAYIGAGCPLP